VICGEVVQSVGSEPAEKEGEEGRGTAPRRYGISERGEQGRAVDRFPFSSFEQVHRTDSPLSLTTSVVVGMVIISYHSTHPPVRVLLVPAIEAFDVFVRRALGTIGFQHVGHEEGALEAYLDSEDRGRQTLVALASELAKRMSTSTGVLYTVKM
jgi:hypothetical protein